MKHPVNKSLKPFLSKRKTQNSLNNIAIRTPLNIPKNIPDSFPQYINNNLKIATLLSKKLYENLKYECHIINLNDVDEIIINESINFLLVESSNYSKKKLFEILNIYNSKNIPAVFWITTPLESFKDIHDILYLFTSIFSIYNSSIDIIKKLVNHDRVFYLPLAVQPRIYNPIHNQKKLLYAGYINPSFLNNKSISDNDILRKPAKDYSAEEIKILDDSINVSNLLKKYHVVLYDSSEDVTNNTINPLLYNLLACGIIIITNYSKDLYSIFGDSILYTHNINETYDILHNLYNSVDYRNKLSLLGQRQIFSDNTYTHRLNTILDQLNLIHLKKKHNGVSVICCTHMQYYLNNIFENFSRQTYDKKELIIVLNDPNMNKKFWQKKADKFNNIKIIQPKNKKSVGYCTNLAVENSKFEYIANFDHDDYYGPEYIKDNLNVFKYTDAGLIGKKTHYVYFEETKRLALKLRNHENRYVINIDGSSLFFKKEIFSKVKFIDNLFADVQFSLDCWNNGIKVYSCDRFNHTYIRRKSKKYHAYKLNDNEYIRRTCKLIAQTDDFRPFINI